MNKLLDSTVEMSDVAPAGNHAAAPSASVSQRLASHIKSRIKDTLSDRQALGSFSLLMSIVGLSVFGGYLLGQRYALVQQDLVIIPASFSDTGSESVAVVVDQTAVPQVTDAQKLTREKEITDQLGLLRAELLRLHTVFAHLAELAELDEGEFDLESPLLDWQEQSSVQQIGLLNRRLAHISGSTRTLGKIYNIRRMAHDQKISGRPLVDGHRTSGFGYRTDPISGERLEHRGLDFSGPVGEPILALADGVVSFSGKNAGYGNLVELEHVDGLRTRYAHNQANLVSRGARVRKGEAIATLGSTGRSTGPHVHIEVRLDGSPIDPEFFVR